MTKRVLYRAVEMTTALLTSDLLFHSRIVSHGHAMGIPVQVIGSPESLCELAQRESLRLVMIDLGTKGMNVEQLGTSIALLKASQPGAYVIAYGPHVDEAGLQAARHIGCDEVLTKGQFDRAILQILERHAKNSASAPTSE